MLLRNLIIDQSILAPLTGGGMKLEASLPLGTMMIPVHCRPAFTICLTHVFRFKGDRRELRGGKFTCAPLHL